MRGGTPSLFLKDYFMCVCTCVYVCTHQERPELDLSGAGVVGGFGPPKCWEPSSPQKPIYAFNY